MKDSTIPDPPPVLKYDGFTFSTLKKIGEGGFARCYELLESSTNKRFALKAIYSEALARLKAKNKLLNEIEIHHKLDHRYIVKLYRVFQDNVFIYLILELCENKTMADLLKQRKTLSEAEVRHYLWMVLCAVSHLHQNHIIHRDLKLANLFLNLEYDIKIGDFGLATTLEQHGDRKKTICGTPNYIAPEILFDKEKGHGFEVDIWAIGIIMYSLLYGRPPFQSSDIKSIYKNIKANSYTFPAEPLVSDSARNLITLILTQDPAQRPKILDIFEHDFFRNVMIKDPTPMELSSVRIHCARLSLKSIKEVGVGVGVVGSDKSDVVKENIPPNKGSIEKPVPPRFSAGKEKKPSTIEIVYKNLCRYLDSPMDEVSAPVIKKEDVVIPDFYIGKYLDYTFKYGLAYLCNNGNVGTYFNDSTSMILNTAARFFEYQYTETNSNSMRQLVRYQFMLDEFPQELSKKVTIIKHFSSLFQEAKEPSKDQIESGDDNAKNFDFVVKFAKIKDAFIFRLSTRAIQAIFPDQYSIVLSSEGQVVSTIYSGGLNSQIKSYALSEIPFTDKASLLYQRLISLKSMLDYLLKDSNHS